VRGFVDVLSLVLFVDESWGHHVGNVRMTSASTPPDAPQATRVAFLDDDLVVRRVLVAAKDVVIIKGICEASEGLCAMFADSGGDLLLAAPHSRVLDLDELVRDLCTDFGAVVADATISAR
jgi:hypothetical protein